MNKRLNREVVYCMTVFGGLLVLILTLFPARLHSAETTGADSRNGSQLRIIDVSGETAPVSNGAEPQGASGSTPPAMAAIFAPFASRVELRWDAEYLYVGSNGIPDHPMMIGITAWQQQVPLPQNYHGGNAWRLPLHPVKAEHPLSAKTGFFRGAIALAADGIPIFNPIKNDGRTDTFLAGELDEYGGHCGRADDYHYHVAPLFLEKIVGPGKPIAVALDGYPIYGDTGPDGSPVDPKTLDAFNGRTDSRGDYYYCSTKTYPYINGGFHGQVDERDGQVDPQPKCIPIRAAGAPLPGAIITAFSSPKPDTYKLTYEVDEEQRSIDGQGRHTYETYRRDGPPPPPR